MAGKDTYGKIKTCNKRNNNDKLTHHGGNGRKGHI